MWKKGKVNRDPAQYRITRQGRMHVSKSKVHPGKWKWDAMQEQPAMIIPDTHWRTGLSPTMREAKAAAEHALAHMIATNA